MQISMGIFMTMMFLVGLILTVYAFKIEHAVKNCSSSAQNAAQNAVRGLLVMGVILLSVSSTYMVCGCGGVGKMIGQGVFSMSFVVLMLAISIIVIVLTSTIHSACPDAQKDTSVLLTLSMLTTVASSGYLLYRGYSQMKSNKIKPGAVEMKTFF